MGIIGDWLRGAKQVGGRQRAQRAFDRKMARVRKGEDPYIQDDEGFHLISKYMGATPEKRRK